MSTAEKTRTQELASAHESAPLRSLSRGIEILSLLGAERPSLSLRDVVEATALPKTSVLRYLQTLEAAHLLWVDRSGRYLLGPQLARWSELAASTWRPSEALSALLDQLVHEAEETIHVYARRSLQRVCIARREVLRPLRHVVDIGEHLPLWGGAASMVLLTDAPLELLEQVAATSLAGADSLGRLRAAVEAARERGSASSEGELEPGLSSVAVPVRAVDGSVLAALSFGGPTVRFDPARVEALRSVLVRAAPSIREDWLPGTTGPLPRHGARGRSRVPASDLAARPRA